MQIIGYDETMTWEKYSVRRGPQFVFVNNETELSRSSRFQAPGQIKRYWKKFAWPTWK